MNKDEVKMIEEMAKVLCDNDKRCEECISRLLLPCGYKSYCTKLYNAGYRKVADDEIVIKKQAYEKFVEEFAKQEEISHSYEQGYTELLETNHQLQDELEKTKKEKKEIFQKLKNNIMFADFGCGDGYEEVVDMDTDELKKLAKSYGIEFED